jgi:hypothetical protein
LSIVYTDDSRRTSVWHVTDASNIHPGRASDCLMCAGPGDRGRVLALRRAAKLEDMRARKRRTRDLLAERTTVLRCLLAGSGLTQAGLARAAGLQTKRVQNIVAGALKDVTDHERIALAGALGVDVDAVPWDGGWA